MHARIQLAAMMGMLMSGMSPMFKEDYGYLTKHQEPSRSHLAKKCLNPNCNEPAVFGRTHCSAECYKSHYGIK